jgi:hypothetical protein
MVKGSCLCGGVTYQVDGDAELMAHCYCSMCRKCHGAPFVTYIGVTTSRFRWVKGQDLIAEYESSPGNHRGFCRICGSALAPRVPAEPLFFLPAGTLDDDPGTRPQAHIFVGSKAPWVDIEDDLPQFSEFPPGFGPGQES